MNDLCYKQQYLLNFETLQLDTRVYLWIYIKFSNKVLYGSFQSIKQTVAGHKTTTAQFT